MKAAIVTIGDEILIGQIIDTNSAYIAKSLDRIGVQTYEMRSISDQREHILQTFQELQNQFDIVILTGGLGPTKDDITKKTLCDYFEDTFVRNAEVEAHVVALIENVLKRPASQINKDQALVPSKAEVLFNQVGTAPGMWIQKENTVFISMPGVPYEMKYIMEHGVLPKIVSTYQRPYILHKTLLTYGQGESVVAERIEAWENALPDFIKLAYLPAPGRVRLRLTARGTDQQQLESEIQRQVELVSAIISDIIVGYDEDETLEVVVGGLLKQKGKTVATAESCTGGKIAQTITSVAGSSAYFKGSVVSYATEAKVDLLGVDPQLIATHSVVSAEVAMAMAKGAQRQLKSDYVLATTGNAGPAKGDSDAEVGTVFIALATPENVVVEGFNFGQPREKVIDRTVNKALEILQKEILKNL
ncbi:CinA family nicotinamide mononucleotide deamidase-related protein [Flavobacterium stagni]|uniref:CinA-like protein n=1 Tax=Flavobacterium stagni TaxID=2506421 RepID=A0A4Q1KBN6_9FLAO|nr:CinA family nicotinamide mononucleotide deamidase-related protein [Flavobacterium stagni]RXR23307.1 CinA family nicotinamide mononucleotide deamidase-related protein [Flavobacterium stagni]